MRPPRSLPIHGSLRSSGKCPLSRRIARGFAVRFIAICVWMTSLALLVTACASVGPKPPQAFVSSAQRTAIARFYIEKLWQAADGSHSFGCPVYVLGAQKIHGQLRVYAVVHCMSFTAKCSVVTIYTQGLVADMVGTRVVRFFSVDSPVGAIAHAEARIYPESIRAKAFGYIDSDGPRWMWDRAAKAAGCPRWT